MSRPTRRREPPLPLAPGGRRAARRGVSRWAMLLGALSFGCNGHGPEAGSRGGVGPGDAQADDGGARVVAQVGPKPIRAETVGAIAAAQGIDARAAADQAIIDALLALGAEQDGLVEQPTVRSGIRGVLARASLRALATESSAGAVSDAELAAATERRWLEVDRPPSFRTVHAVALLGEKADAAKRTRAGELTARWREALEPVAQRVAESRAPVPADPERVAASVADDAIRAFSEAVRAIDAGGAEVRVEPLPPVTCDGRVVADDAAGQQFDPTFARAACALTRRGELSPVTASPFGLHVIMLLDIVPPKRLDEVERRRLLRDDILTHRARDAHRALLERLRARHAVELPPNVDALLRLVSTEP